MTSWLTDPFQADMVLRALLAGLIAACLCSLVGCWVLLRRSVFLGEAMTHGMLPGVARAVSAEADPRLNNRFDRYDALFKTAAPVPQPPRPAADEGGSQQPGPSLRERLLARAPSSNLLKR